MQRVSSHQALELSGKHGVAAEREVGVDSAFNGSHRHDLKASHLGLGEGIVAAFAQHRAAHQQQGITQSRRRAGETPVLQVGFGYRQHPLEPVGVDLAIERPQLIAGRLALDALAARQGARRGQGAAEPGDIGVQRALGA
jgi:hypothetical protein